MSSRPFIIHSKHLAEGQSGELLHFSRESVQWEWMSMDVRRLNPGEAYETVTQGEEAAFVILGGRCAADWGKGKELIGGRKMCLMDCPTAFICPPGIR